MIDGRLDEPAWREAPASDAFTQKRPFQGQPPVERTLVRVLYDDSAVYVGVVCEQTTAPVVARLTRRDRQVESDSVTIGLDTRGDSKSAFEFTVNAAGVLSDGIYANDTDFSRDWDEIWEARTAILTGAAHADPHDPRSPGVAAIRGWSAELRIPLHALRYDPKPIQEWGIQVRRYVSARQELDEWSFTPRERAGEVSHYGRLDGIAGLRGANHLELLPFLTAKIQRYDSAVDVRTGVTPRASAGLDLRWHVTPQLTLNATVNPDFGQVEADPAVLNLESFEIVLPEKRPFFLEGADVFTTPLNLLYTRRIGRAPSAPALLDEAPYGEQLVRDPEPVPIYGAAKLVGDLGRGVSIGELVAVTGPERAPALRSDGSTVMRAAAPLTAFKVLRLRRAVGAGGQIGIIGMSTNRLESAGDYPTVPGSGAAPRRRCPGDEEVRSGQRCFHDAYVAGIDGRWRSPSGDYALSGQAVGSLIAQGPPRMQRDGTVIASGDAAPAGYVRAAKEGGNWLWETWYEGEGRKVDYNDLGYMRRQNHLAGYAAVRYRTVKPWWHTLETTTSLGAFDQETLSWLNLERGMFIESDWKLKNFWEVYLNFAWKAPRFDDREVGDGTALERGGFVSTAAWLGTDPRSRVRAEVFSFVDILRKALRWDVEATLTFNALPQLDISLAPTAFYSDGEQRYFATEGGAYLFGALRGQSLGLTLRSTYTFTPRLTLEAYAQAFLAMESYRDYTAFPMAPRGPRPHVRLSDLRPAPAAVVDNPDSESATLNANVVLRWEYLLGSTLFLVYTHGQHDDRTPDRDASAKLRFPLVKPRPASDALLLKLSYWWG